MAKRMIYVLTIMGKHTQRVSVVATGHSVELLKQYCEREHMLGETLFWESPIEGQHSKDVVTWANQGRLIEYQISKSIMLVGGTMIKRCNNA